MTMIMSSGVLTSMMKVSRFPIYFYSLFVPLTCYSAAAMADVTPSRPSSSIRTQGLVATPVPTYPDRPEVIVDRASTSTAPSHHIPSSASEFGVSPSGARVLSVNERAKACSAEDQLQLLAEASEANSERRHKDILRMQEATCDPQGGRCCQEEESSCRG
ncbi:hypothetical protein, variant 2 [Cryptococcus neoformans var. grubii H99]|uniref:Uncharacterized protein n=1 Tax=Cryptococcus neoformans (strain H99 / ATCC 208821 / CBS 10515 / FGSC 9487) TaxID=235443 RepID=T2BNS8_CRYN9|nr:hypothetical protein, variant 2 [Cryptococcus neoformans var. grubii H99]AGV14371.1 hypothetical protein, variant 2 [Cryptococcus neoformans var. grubii H99]AUB24998.1 hypothetical protein CKF44_00903 [Cryptococcus neoformans var. grubii]|eukprot:XP_012049184.1 hypothetical protein, variant 2 [Cryptococcus neoformans var. grubii H99]